MKQDLIGNRAVGIDIGTNAVKIAVAQKHGSGFTVDATVEVAIEREDCGRREQEAIQAALTEALRQVKVGEDVVVTSIPTNRAAVRNIEMPFDDMEMVRQIVKSEIEPHIPFPVEQVVVDFYDTETTEEGKMDVVLTAVNKTIIQEQLDMAHEADLEPEMLGIDFMAVFDTVAAVRPDLEQESYMIVDIGASNTTVLYVLEGKPMAVRSIPLAGDAMTQAIMKELNVTAERAEQLKRQYGDATAEIEDITDETQKSVQQALDSVLDRFHQELTRTIRYFSSQIASSDYNRIMLTGGAAHLTHMAELVSHLFSAPAEVLTQSEDTTGDADPALYSSAIGAALAGIGLSQHKQDFRQEEYSYPETLKRVKKYLYTSAVLGVALIAVLIVGFGHRASKLDAYYKALRADTDAKVKLIDPTFSGDVETNTIGAKLTELRKEIELLKGINTSSTLDILRDFTTRISADMKVQIDSFSISERKIVMKGTIKSQDDMYTLKQKLEESPFVESIAEPTSQDFKGRRKFSFTIKPKE